MRCSRSRSGIKSAILGAIFFTLALHIMQAMWVSEYTSFRLQFKCKQMKDFERDTAADIMGPWITANISTTARMSIKPVGDYYYRWKSGNIQCSYKNDSMQVTRLRDALPSKYAEVIWPPTNISLCGEGALLTPWFSDKKGKGLLLLL